MTDETEQPPAADHGVPVPGPVLAGGIGVAAAAMLGAASLGWAGVAILVAFLLSGCALLVWWTR